MGTIMHKGEMYGGGGSNSNLITLPWAEYNALPAADKADLNKYYYIEDLNTGSDLVTQISNPADNQFLMYDSSKGLWVNHAGGLYQYIPLTEDEYNALTTEQKNDPSKLYYVTDVDVVNANIDDTTISTEKVWSSKKVSDEVDTINSKIDHGSCSANLSNNTYGTAITALKNAGYDVTKLTINSKIIFYYNSVRSTIYTINNIENQWFQSVTTTGSGTSCITLRMTDSKAYQSLGSTFADISNEILTNVNKIEIVY